MTAVGRHRGDVEVAVIEIQMPIETGLATIAALRAKQPSLVIVVCSFHTTHLDATPGSRRRRQRMLVNPISPKALLAACQTTHGPQYQRSSQSQP